MQQIDKRDLWRKQKQEYRQNREEVTLTFSLPDFAELKEEADALRMRPQEYIRIAIAAAKNNIYIFPNNDVVQDLILHLRRIGSNINQTVRHIHSSQHIHREDIEKLQEQLANIEKEVKKAFGQS